MADWDSIFGIIPSMMVNISQPNLPAQQTLQQAQQIPSRVSGELTTVPYGDINGYNERSMQNEKDWAAIKDRLAMGLTPQQSEKQFISKKEMKDKQLSLVLHWTGDQYKYSGIDKNTGEKIWKLDAEGNKIQKSIEDLMKSMQNKSVQYMMTGITTDTPEIKQTLSTDLVGAHTIGAKTNPKNEKTWITEPENVGSYTRFPTKVSNRNAIGIEVAYDPNLKGNKFSEKGAAALREFIITTMLQKNLSPKDIYAHSEIQKKTTEHGGEMVDFIKDFRKNLPQYLDEYAQKNGFKQ
jgi:hypothetical protein